MRKIILALALILSLGFSNTAQAFSFDWGVTGGYNLTKLKLDGELDNVFNSNNRSGWFLGAKINVGLFMGFGADGALLYSQDKIKLHGASNTNIYETQRAFQMPLNLKYSIGLGKIANIYATTGPQFEFNLGDDNSNWGDKKFSREDVTTSWNVGAGAKLFGHLDLGVVYNFGISKFGESFMNDVVGHDYIHAGDAKSSSFKVQLTYYF